MNVNEDFGSMPGGFLLPPTILVADDDEDNRVILCTMLEDEGYRVLLARDGREALRKAALGVDLIILDIDMPVLDGLKACAALQAQAATREIPILFLSAFDQKMMQAAARRAGALDYLEKPIDPAQLFTKVRALLRLQGVQRGVEGCLPYASAVRHESAREQQEARAQLAQWHGFTYGA